MMSLLFCWQVSNNPPVIRFDDSIVTRVKHAFHLRYLHHSVTIDRCGLEKTKTKKKKKKKRNL